MRFEHTCAKEDRRERRSTRTTPSTPPCPWPRDAHCPSYGTRRSAALAHASQSIAPCKPTLSFSNFARCNATSHTHAYTHSYTQYGNKTSAKCTRDHLHIHIHQLQLMQISRSRNVLVVSPRNVISSVCILLYVSSCIAGRRHPNSISLKFGLNYTCGVLPSCN